MRVCLEIEILGTSFVPQHPDARILDQFIYKWGHSCGFIADVFTGLYTHLLNAGAATACIT